MVKVSTFILMHRDKEVLSFSDELNLNGDYTVLHIMNRKQLPYVIKNNLSSLKVWLKSRVIPSHRNHIETLRSFLKLSEEATTLDYLKCNNGFSLNDDYWIKSKCDISWEDYNLYTNDFYEDLGLVTFLGTAEIESNVSTPSIASPELTTGGVMNKAWRKLNNRLLLYKRGSVGAVNLDKEHYVEAITSDIARILNIEHVTYWVNKWHNQNCSVCEIFTNEGKGYVPMSVFNPMTFLDTIEWFNNHPSLSKQDLQAFYDMIVFDFIIENRDRHLGNFGFILNNDTQEIECFAPLFDHGYSLLHACMESDTIDYDSYSETSASFNVSNKKLAEYVIKLNPCRYKHWAKKLAMTIKYINYFDCPEWYVSKIQALLVSRCNILKNI